LVERLVRNEKARGSNPLTSSPESFRGCHAGGRRGDRRRTFNVLHERGELRLGKSRLEMAKFFYVYGLQSHVDPERFYTGLTDDLSIRLKRHNSGEVLHTAKWKMDWRADFNIRGVS